MRRLASLYNGVAMEQMLATCWEELLYSRLWEDNVLKIEAQPCREPTAQSPIFKADVSEEMRRTFVSINKCILVLAYNTGWLAHCTRGKQLISSLDRASANQEHRSGRQARGGNANARVHDVELQLIDEDEPENTNCAHVVLVLKPRNGGEPIVADATYAQYSFKRGIDTLAEYLATKVYAPLGYEEPLGDYLSWDARTHLSCDAQTEESTWDQGNTAAIARTTDNVMVGELELVGGFKGLLDMSVEVFQEARVKICVAVKTEMKELRRRLETIRYGKESRLKQDLNDLVKSCHGAGHRECLWSYWNARGNPIS